MRSPQPNRAPLSMLIEDYLTVTNTGMPQRPHTWTLTGFA